MEVITSFLFFQRFGSIREYCVSCQGHPDAEGCPAQHMNTTPALSTSSESPHGGDDSNPVQDKETKCGQKKGREDEIIISNLIKNCSSIHINLTKIKRKCKVILVSSHLEKARYTPIPTCSAIKFFRN